MLIGIAARFVVNLTGLRLPDAVWAAVDLMVRATIPAALFGLGGRLRRYRPEGDVKTIEMVGGRLLLVHPTVTWGPGRFRCGQRG